MTNRRVINLLKDMVADSEMQAVYIAEAIQWASTSPEYAALFGSFGVNHLKQFLDDLQGQPKADRDTQDDLPTTI